MKKPCKRKFSQNNGRFFVLSAGLYLQIVIGKVYVFQHDLQKWIFCGFHFLCNNSFTFWGVLRSQMRQSNKPIETENMCACCRRKSAGKECRKGCSANHRATVSKSKKYRNNLFVFFIVVSRLVPLRRRSFSAKLTKKHLAAVWWTKRKTWSGTFQLEN